MSRFFGLTSQARNCSVLLAALVLSCGVASANPATPIPVIDDNARILCDTVNQNPTQGGVIAGVDLISLGPLDALDVAYVLITAVHHTCPQHERLIMGVVEEFAYPDGTEGCRKS